MLFVSCSGIGGGGGAFLTLSDYVREFSVRPNAELETSGVLTLERAQTLALENNPTYIGAYYSVKAARYRYYQALAPYLPRVDLGSEIVHSLEKNTSLENPPPGVEPYLRPFSASNSLTVSLLLFDGLEREFNALASRRAYMRETAADSDVRRLLLRGVAFAYYDAILASERIRIAESNLEFQLSSLLQAEERYRFGHVSKAAVLNFKILASEAQSEILNANYAYRAARYALAELMGFSTRELPDTLKLTPLKIRESALEGGMGFYISEAVRRRPDLTGARYALEQASYMKYASYSGFMPVLTAYAGGSAGANSDKAVTLERTAVRQYYNSYSFDYGLSASWNLFSGFSTLNLIRERSALETVARYELGKTFLAVVNEVKTAYINYENLYSQVALYREMLEWVFEQRKLVAASYWAGADTITRLNGAQSDLVGAESRLAQSLAELNKAEAQLRAAVNMEPDTEHFRAYTLPSSGTPLEKLFDMLEARFN